MSEHEALEEIEEVDAFSLISKNEDDDHDTGDEIDTDTEDIEELKERISKRNKSLRKSKEAIHRIQDENQALVERLEKLEARLSQESGERDTAVDPAKLEQEAQEWADRVADDPVNAIKYADYKQEQLERGLNRWADSFEKKMLDMIGGLESKTNPERLKYESELAVLKQNPEFKGMTDEQLLPVARMLKNTKVKRPPGSVGGKRVTEKPESRFSLSKEDEEAIRNAVRG